MIIDKKSFSDTFERIAADYKKTLENTKDKRAIVDRTIYQEYYMLDIKKACLQMLQFLEKDTVLLDLGNGISPIAAIMAKFLKAVYASDILKQDWNLKLWSQMSRKYGFTQYAISGKEPLPHSRRFFDGVCMYAVLEHIGSSEELIYKKLEPITKTVKKGGFIFIFRTPQKFSYIENLERLLGVPCHQVLLEIKKVRKEFEKLGFSEINFESYGLLPDFWANKTCRYMQSKHVIQYYKTNKFLSDIPVLKSIARDMTFVFRKDL